MVDSSNPSLIDPWASQDAKRHRTPRSPFGRQQPVGSPFREAVGPYMEVSAEDVERHLDFRQRKRLQRESATDYASEIDYRINPLLSVDPENSPSSKRPKSQQMAAARQKPLFSIEEVRLIAEKVVASKIAKATDKMDQVLMQRTQEQYHSLMQYLQEYIRRQDEASERDSFSYVS